MTLKTIGHHFYATQALRIISQPLVDWNWRLETPNSGQNRWFFVPCDLKIWRMTLKNNRAPLLCYFKLCASFHSHQWIQTWATIWKRLNYVLTSVTLTFDLNLLHGHHLILSMVITPENFMMIYWWEHSKKQEACRPIKLALVLAVL